MPLTRCPKKGDKLVLKDCPRDMRNVWQEHVGKIVDVSNLCQGNPNIQVAITVGGRPISYLLYPLEKDFFDFVPTTKTCI